MAENCVTFCAEIERIQDWVGLYQEHDGAYARKMEAEDRDYLASFIAGCDTCPGAQTKVIETPLSFQRIRSLIGKPTVRESVHLECPRTGTISQEPFEGTL